MSVPVQDSTRYAFTYPQQKINIFNHFAGKTSSYSPCNAWSAAVLSALNQQQTPNKPTSCS